MIKRELRNFLIVGILSVGIDWTCYLNLIQFQIIGVDMAKATGFLAGTLFAYFANRFWTFSHTLPAAGSVWRFLVLYASTLCANVLINTFALKLLSDRFAIELGFLLATCVSASLNFLGMRLFVFKTSLSADFQ